MYNEKFNGDFHELKIIPKYYKDVLNEIKTFEVRKFDRDYKVNDILMLKEWTPESGYTKKWITRKISYILNDENYCKKGYVILGLVTKY